MSTEPKLDKNGFTISDLVKALRDLWGSYKVPYYMNTLPGHEGLLKKSTILKTVCTSCGYEDESTVSDLLKRKEIDGYPCRSCKDRFDLLTSDDMPDEEEEEEIVDVSETEEEKFIKTVGEMIERLEASLPYSLISDGVVHKDGSGKFVLSGSCPYTHRELEYSLEDLDKTPEEFLITEHQTVLSESEAAYLEEDEVYSELEINGENVISTQHVIDSIVHMLDKHPNLQLVSLAGSKNSNGVKVAALPTNLVTFELNAGDPDFDTKTIVTFPIYQLSQYEGVFEVIDDNGNLKINDLFAAESEDKDDFILEEVENKEVEDEDIEEENVEVNLHEDRFSDDEVEEEENSLEDSNEEDEVHEEEDFEIEEEEEEEEVIVNVSDDSEEEEEVIVNVSDDSEEDAPEPEIDKPKKLSFDDDDDEDYESVVVIDNDAPRVRTHIESEAGRENREYGEFSQNRVFGKSPSKRNVFRRAERFQEREDPFTKSIRDIVLQALDHPSIKSEFRVVGVSNTISVTGFNVPYMTLECINTKELLNIIGINLRDETILQRLTTDFIPFSIEKTIQIINHRFKNRVVRNKVIFNEYLERPHKQELLLQLLGKYMRYLAFGYEHNFAEKFIDSDHRFAIVTDTEAVRKFEQTYQLDVDPKLKSSFINMPDGKQVPSGSLAITSIKEDDIEEIQKMFGNGMFGGFGFNNSAPMQFGQMGGGFGMNPFGMGGAFGPQVKQQQAGPVGDLFCSIRYLEVPEKSTGTTTYTITSYIEHSVVSVQDGLKIALAGLLARHFNERPQFRNVRIKIEIDKTSFESSYVMDNLTDVDGFSMKDPTVPPNALSTYSVRVGDSKDQINTYTHKDFRFLNTPATIISVFGHKLRERNITVNDYRKVNQFLDEEGFRKLHGAATWVYEINPIFFFRGSWSQYNDLYRYSERFFGKMSPLKEQLNNSGGNYDAETQATISRMLQHLQMEKMKEAAEKHARENQYKVNESDVKQTVQEIIESKEEVEEDDGVADWAKGHILTKSQIRKNAEEQARKAAEEFEKRQKAAKESSSEKEDDDNLADWAKKITVKRDAPFNSSQNTMNFQRNYNISHHG